MSDRMFTLSIRMEGAAFGEEGPDREYDQKQAVALLLVKAALMVGQDLERAGPLMDDNGNTVGRFWMTGIPSEHRSKE
jgi:hypothetical protein